MRQVAWYPLHRHDVPASRHRPIVYDVVGEVIS
jgi:hypothetical protein